MTESLINIKKLRKLEYSASCLGDSWIVKNLNHWIVRTDRRIQVAKTSRMELFKEADE